MRTVAAGVVLLLAAVSGCSGSEPAPAEVRPLASASASADVDDEANLQSVPTATPSQTATPTATLSQTATQAAPSALEPPSTFAQRYINALSVAYQAPDSARLRAMSDDGCGGCNNFIQAVDEAVLAKERTVGGDFRLLAAAAPEPERGETIVELQYARDAAVVVDRAGGEVARLPADPPIEAQMRLRAVGTSWTVLGFRATPG